MTDAKPKTRRRRKPAQQPTDTAAHSESTSEATAPAVDPKSCTLRAGCQGRTQTSVDDRPDRIVRTTTCDTCGGAKTQVEMKPEDQWQNVPGKNEPHQPKAAG